MSATELYLTRAPVAPLHTRVALGAARAKLRTPRRRDPVLALVGAAALLALSSFGFAAAVILGPPDLSARTAGAAHMAAPVPAGRSPS